MQTAHKTQPTQSKPIRVVKLSGAAYEMGSRHGEIFHDAIHLFTADRIQLCQDANWTGHRLTRSAVIELAEACVEAHQHYAPDLMDELQGMADATGLSLAELVINNGFTDFIDVIYNLGGNFAKGAQPAVPQQVADNCTAFLVPNSRSADGRGFLGQTWDMHASATPYVILLHGEPADSPAFLTFTITGCIGMIGLNSAGIAVGINNLMATDGQIGVTWPFVVRKILQQDNLADALECLTSAPLAGAHNYILMDRHGDGVEVEAMSTAHHVHRLTDETIAHTNHCLIQDHLRLARQRPPASQNSSENRLQRARQLLAQDSITIDDLIALTRDEVAICTRPKPPMDVESCGAAIMQPGGGDFWAVWGLPAENDCQHFVI